MNPRRKPFQPTVPPSVAGGLDSSLWRVSGRPFPRRSPMNGTAPSGGTLGLRSRGYWVRVPARPQHDLNSWAPSQADKDRFWSKVSGGGPGCWAWTAYRGSHGYGMFRLGDRAAAPQRAHRVAFVLAKGPLPDGAVIRHTCDNKACVNPAHLETGTQAENVADAIERGLMDPAGLVKWHAARRAVTP